MNRRDILKAIAASPALTVPTHVFGSTKDPIEKLFTYTDGVLTSGACIKTKGFLNTLRGWEFHEDPLINKKYGKSGFYCYLDISNYFNLKIEPYILLPVSAEFDYHHIKNCCINGSALGQAIDFESISDSDMERLLKMFRDKYSIH